MCISDWSSGLCSSDLPITRIICTHFHPDHLGLAGWPQERWNAPLWMTHGEWTFGRMLELEAAPQVPPEEIGRAPCRERVCQVSEDTGGGRSTKKKALHTNSTSTQKSI